MKYGELPVGIGIFYVDCKEMMFYQDMPVKLSGTVEVLYEERLKPFAKIIAAAKLDFIRTHGYNTFKDWYMYVSAKYLYQPKNKPYNRPGWHSDGFMTDDVNYIWCDKNPTVFNMSDFKLSQDDGLSMREMAEQALPENDITLLTNSLLRLDQYNIHKVADEQEEGYRTFLKVSFSKSRFNLIGNARNYLLDYDWEMVSRSKGRNQPNSDKNPERIVETDVK